MNPSQAAKDGGDDLAILHPERRAIIAGVPVVMREYSFAESLEHYAMVAALSDALTGIALAGNFHDLDSLRPAFGACWETVLALIAIACDQPVAWVRALGAADGEQLYLLWWGVNADFFLRRVLLSVQLHKVREVGARAGSTSSPPSSAPGTPPAISPATRSVN